MRKETKYLAHFPASESSLKSSLPADRAEEKAVKKEMEHDQIL